MKSKKSKMKKIPEFDRPREKMSRKGARALSDIELLAVLLGSGIKGRDVFTIAGDILKLVEDGFENLTFEKIRSVEGVGLAKTCQLIAAIEFSRRRLLKNEAAVKTADDVCKLVDELRGKKQEYFITLTLDGASNLIQKRVIFIGTLNQSLVHPREVFADAISDRAASIILVHNHPSGSVRPSKEDMMITNRLSDVGLVVGIKIKDHVIIGKDNYFSFSAKKLL